MGKHADGSSIHWKEDISRETETEHAKFDALD